MKINFKYFQAAVLVFYGSVFFGLFLLVVFRAYQLSFTYDECLSYTILKGNIALKDTANHHFLNTWLMALCMFLFGESPFSLRLPNVLSFLIYLWVCYQLLRSANLSTSLLVGIPLLLLNAYLLDFFSLARGYGLSMAFMLLSVFYFLQLNLKLNSIKKSRDLFIKIMFFASLALAANLNLINFYLAILGMTVLIYLYTASQVKNEGIKTHFIFIGALVLFCLPLLLAAIRLLALNKGGQLYFGTDSFDNTFFFLTLASFDFTYCAGECPTLFIYLVKIIFILSLIYAVWKKKYDSAFFKVWLLIFLIVLGVFLEHWLFGTLYPMNRTSVFLVPLYGLLVFLFFAEMVQQLPPVKFVWIHVLISVVFTLPFCIHFYHRINVNVVSEWSTEADTKYVTTELEKERAFEPNSNDSLRLSAHWFFLPALDYYSASKHQKIKTFKLEGSPDPKNNYLYDFNDNVDTIQWKLMRSFDDTRTGLYKRKAMLQDSITKKL